MIDGAAHTFLTPRSPPVRLSAPLRPLPAALRVAAAAAIGWPVAIAMAAPELPVALKAAALATLAGAVWRPAVALVATITLASGALLLAPGPVRGAELLAWAFLCGWLLAVWRPVGRSPGDGGIATIAMLYAGCLTASWLGVVLGASTGVRPLALAGFLARSLPPDHLIFSSPEPETWSALQALTGVAILTASMFISRAERRLATWLAIALVAVTTCLAALTLGGVVRSWSQMDYAGWFLLRFVRGEPFSTHLSDMNAAGSQYLLAGLIAVGFAIASRRRWPWSASIAVMLVGLVFSGSRTAMVGAVVFGGIVLWITGAGGTEDASSVPQFRLARRSARRRTTVITVVAIAAITAAVLVSRVVSARINNDEYGSAEQSLEMRSAFMQTSLRMFATAPVFGVGVGMYYPRSAALMPPGLRAFYPDGENAHNYFVQQFAELGLVGGCVFLVLVVTGLRSGWRAVKANSADAAIRGLFAGTAAYLLTCVTGHPLLVPEAALPFWAAFGALAGTAPAEKLSPRRPWHLLPPVVAMLLIGFVISRAASSRRMPAAPPESGFHDQHIEDGTRYRWTTRHAVTWVGSEAGFVVISARAPDFLQRARPFVLEVDIDGAVAARATIAADRWQTVTVPVRRAAKTPKRRVDLRVNQVWSAKHDRDARSPDDRPMGVMVREVTLTPSAPVEPGVTHEPAQ